MALHHPVQPAAAAKPVEDIKRTIRYRLIGCEHELELALEECERYLMGANLKLSLSHALQAVQSSLEKNALIL